MLFNEHENHHFHEEYEIHMRYENYKANGCRQYLDLCVRERESSWKENVPLKKLVVFLCVHTTKHLPILKHLNHCNDYGPGDHSPT